MEEKDMVNHPSHYISETGMEVIDAIEAFTFDLKGIEAVDTGNILKYVCRWKKKNGLQDLQKAKWYLEHLIAHVENRGLRGRTRDITRRFHKIGFGFKKHFTEIMVISGVIGLVGSAIMACTETLEKE